MQNISAILQKDTFTQKEIIDLLKVDGGDKLHLFEKALDIKQQYVQNKVYFRGLIEFSNICSKDCLYCGIRKSNSTIRRYNLNDDEIINAARFAFESDYASIVLQSGELSGRLFTKRISSLLEQIMKMSDNKLRVTLSCGEQSTDTYKEWFDHGTTRYLLRIETSNRDLYYKLHPRDDKHSFDVRLACLQNIKSIGYQTGTGVMIGLPFQTVEDLANDLLWMISIDIDMVGMGPYLEHVDTPLYQMQHDLLPVVTRFNLTLKMIAILRIMMKDINIAAPTALQSIDKLGREKAIKIGANVIMPNITPGQYRDDYRLYDNKPCTDENPEDCKSCLEIRIALANNDIAYGEWGDSIHYK